MMIFLQGKGYQAAFDETNGGLRSFSVDGQEQLALNAASPLAEIRMLGTDRELHLFSSNDAGAVTVSVDGQKLTAVFGDFPDYAGLTFTVTAVAGEDGLSFETEIDNQTDAFVENFACPCVSVPDNLIGDGGDSRVFWTYCEGVVYEESGNFWGEHIRTGTIFSSLIYPGLVQMQYMARYANGKGVYYAAHDTKGLPKAMAIYKFEGNLRMDIRPFPCVAAHTQWKQDFPIVMKPMEGDWQDASEIYRDFVENSDFPLPPKVNENPRMPKWINKHPVVTIYPPRSIRGSGYMGPNEFFPYVNSIKYLEDLSEDLESEIMTFLPYWEGTAPWAGPYSWPPYGGEEPFLEYVQKMREKGWPVGVYASGVNWTDKHLTVTDYDRTQDRIDQNLTEVMCQLPSGELLPGVCGSIRTGYRMCSNCEETKKIAYDEFGHMLDAGVEYAQYFDQHMGGEGYICYADNHGHPACYGKWSVDSMQEIYETMCQAIESKNADASIGTEGAPADFYANKMFVNDLRWHMNMARGIPVPAYSYVLHNYTLNFMGNQCGVDSYVCRMENPETMQFAVGYSFAACDLLTAILKSGGELHYDWGLNWLHPGPRQNPLKKLMKDCNAMRRLQEKYLQGGRMLKLLPFEQPGEYRMTRRNGTSFAVGEVLASHWLADDGDTMQVFVNHTTHDVEITFDASYKAAVNSKGEAVWTDGKKVIPALSTVAVTLE